jgi:hypothetical protein
MTEVSASEPHTRQVVRSLTLALICSLSTDAGSLDTGLLR